MSDTLKFDLTVSTSRAEKSTTAFVNKVKKKLERIEIGADAHANTKAFEKLRKEYDKNDKAFERMMNRMKAIREKDLVDARNAAIERGKIWEKAAKVREAAAKKQMRDGEAHAKAIEKGIAKEANAVKRAGDARIKIEEDFIHRANLLALQYNMQGEDIAERHQANLVRIVREGGHLSNRELRRQLEIANVIQAREMQQMAQQRQQYTLFGTKFGNKTNQNLFMVQQAIEDFSYAGLRGATNNLAMMASTMGGPGGLIALGTVLGLTVVPTLAKSFGLLDNSIFNADERLKKMGERFERFKKIREGYEAGLSSFSIGTSGFDLQGKLTENNGKAMSLESQQEQLVNKMEVLRRFYKELHNFHSNMEGTWAGDGPDRSKIEAVRKELEALGFTAQNLNDMEGLGIRSSVTGKVDPTVMDPLKKEAAELQDQLTILNKINKAYEDKMLFFQQLTNGQERMNRSFEMGLDAEKGLSEHSLEGRSSKGYDRLLDDILYNRGSSRRSADAQTDREIQKRLNIIQNLMVFHADEATTADTIAKLEKEILDLQEQRSKKYGEINGKAQKEVDTLNQRRNLIAEMQHMTQTAISNTEKQIEAEKRLQEEIKNRITALEKAQTAARNSFLGDKFDMERAIGRKGAGEQKERLDKNLDVGLKQALAQNEAMFAPQIAMLDRLSYINSGKKGSEGFRRMLSRRKQLLSQTQQNRAEQIKNSFTQRREEGMLGIDRRLQAQEAQKQLQYEGMLSERANKLGASGDLEGQRDALQELYGLQKQQAMQGQTAGEMQKTFDRAEKTHERMMAVMDAMKAKEQEALEASQQRQEKEQARLVTLNQVMAQLSAKNIFSESEAGLNRILMKLNEMKVGIGPLGANAGVPPAPVVAPKPEGVPVTSNNTTYNVNVAGVPQRPSLTMRELATISARNAKAAAQRTGMA